jgi:hypothetical protein
MSSDGQSLVSLLRGHLVVHLQSNLTNPPQASSSVTLPSERLILPGFRIVNTNNARRRAQRWIEALVCPVSPRTMVGKRMRPSLLIVMQRRRILNKRLTSVSRLWIMEVRHAISEICVRGQIRRWLRVSGGYLRQLILRKGFNRCDDNCFDILQLFSRSCS